MSLGTFIVFLEHRWRLMLTMTCWKHYTTLSTFRVHNLALRAHLKHTGGDPITESGVVNFSQKVLMKWIILGKNKTHGAWQLKRTRE